MSTFLEAAGRHDGQVDCTAEVDQISIRLILDLDLLLDLILLLVFAVRGIVTIIVFAVTSFAKNLSFELLICLFVLLPLRVKLEDIESVKNLPWPFEVDILMRDLVLFLYKIQLLLDRRVVLVSFSSDLEENLYHVLNALIDVCLV